MMTPIGIYTMMISASLMIFGTNTNQEMRLLGLFIVAGWAMAWFDWRETKRRIAWQTKHSASMARY